MENKDNPNQIVLALEAELKTLNLERSAIAQRNRLLDLKKEPIDNQLYERRINHIDYSICMTGIYIKQMAIVRHGWEIDDFAKVSYEWEDNTYVSLLHYQRHKEQKLFFNETNNKSSQLLDPHYPDELCEQGKEHMEKGHRLRSTVRSLQKRNQLEQIALLKEESLAFLDEGLNIQKTVLELLKKAKQIYLEKNKNVI